MQRKTLEIHGPPPEAPAKQGQKTTQEQKQRAATCGDPSFSTSCGRLATGLTVSTRSQNPKLPAGAPGCTWNSYCAVPTRADAWTADTDPAQACTPSPPVRTR